MEYTPNFEHGLFTQMKNAKQKTIWLLTNYPLTRDCDNTLYVYYVLHEAGSGDKDKGQKLLKQMTALDYLKDMSDHSYVNFASLIRGRRLIQANPDYAHLEGTKKDDRGEADDYWRNNINDQ